MWLQIARGLVLPVTRYHGMLSLWEQMEVFITCTYNVHNNNISIVYNIANTFLNHTTHIQTDVLTPTILCLKAQIFFCYTDPSTKGVTYHFCTKGSHTVTKWTLVTLRAHITDNDVTISRSSCD